MPTVNNGALSHLCDLIDGIEPLKRRRVWQREFETTIAAHTTQRASLAGIEQVLARLPSTAWHVLKATILGQIDLHNAARGWVQALPLLNEARAYDYLVRQGYDDVEFLTPQANTKSPDLRATRNGETLLCEVKTLRVAKRDALAGNLSVKLAKRLSNATRQLSAIDAPDATCMIYLVLDIGDNSRPSEIREQIDFLLAGIDLEGISIVVDGSAPAV